MAYLFIVVRNGCLKSKLIVSAIQYLLKGLKIKI